jgi:hypothetical protein
LPGAATPLPIDRETRQSHHGRREAAAGLCQEDGEGRNRTGDTTVFSRVLYQLSYLARRAAV